MLIKGVFYDFYKDWRNEMKKIILFSLCLFSILFIACKKSTLQYENNTAFTNVSELTQEPTQEPPQEPPQEPTQEATQKPPQEPTQKPPQEPTQEAPQEPTQEATEEEKKDDEIAISDKNFPDASFREYIKTAIDLDYNGTLSLEEREAVYSIRSTNHDPEIKDESNVNELDGPSTVKQSITFPLVQKIQSFEGINYFPNIYGLYLESGRARERK